MKIIAVIPARLGSQRVKQKNLRPLDGQPLILYAIQAAKKAKTVSEIYVNTESDVLGQIAIENGVKYYKRNQKLADDTSTSDDFNYDFMKNVEADVVVMVNPVAPLITGEDIDKMVHFYLENKFDTLIPVREERLHAFVDQEPANFEVGHPVKSFCPAKPINFDIEGQLPKTQDLRPVKICAWTVCIWRPEVFIKSFETKGHGVFSGKIGFYLQDHFKALKISTEEDFVLAEILKQNEHKWRIQKVPYDSETVDLSMPSMWLKEIECIQRLLLEQARPGRAIRILEWGSGRSTVYFSKFLKNKGIEFKWHSIENFVPWYEIVQSMIKQNGVDDTTRCFLKSPTHEERKVLQERMDMSEFIDFPDTLNQKFDFILVDARKRKECLEKAVQLVAKDGVVVLHDAERLEGDPVFRAFKNGGHFICETPSPVPGGIQKLWVGRLLV